MNSAVNKLIIAAGVILVVLIIVTVLVGSLFSKNQASQQPTLIPTGILNETGGGAFGGNPTPTLSEQEKQQLEQKVNEINNNVLSLDQTNRLDQFTPKLPISTNDFAIGYSNLLGQFFVQKKTPQTDAALQKYLQDNNFLDVYQQFPDLFVTTQNNQTPDQAIQQAEQNFENVGEEFQQQQLPSLTPMLSPSSKVTTKQSVTKQKTKQEIEKEVQSLGAIIGSLFNLNFSDELKINQSNAPGPSGNTGGGEITTTGNGTFTDNQISQALMNIFLEAGNTVKIAPKLLAAIMSRECATVLHWSQNQIINHPTLVPGDYCYTNGFAYGPMQFSQGTWAGYAARITELVKHKANVENIRDAVFGAAIKLKGQSGAKDPFNLTQEEVFRAASYYNTGHLTSSGGCANLSYCQGVWDYYNNH